MISARRDSGPALDARPELADIGRLARRMLRRVTAAARAEDGAIARLLREHLGSPHGELPVVTSTWPAYDHANVQSGVDAWLGEDGRRHELIGLTGFRHREFGLADLLQFGREAAYVGTGSVALSARPSGPGGRTLGCVQCGVYLIDQNGTRLALLMRGSDERGPSNVVTVEVCAADETTAQRALDEVRLLSVERNVFRGNVLAFGGEVFGDDSSGLLKFLDRPQVTRAEVILPPAVLEGIERHVLGIARHSGRLLASGQHIKRGVLLHGPPGTGKTHTLRYLIGQRPGATVIIVSGNALHFIAGACSIARTLQPALVVIEDVDLIAEEREYRLGQNALLFQLLNEMDGIGPDADVTFLLTTNRADLLEEALAARPGRIDHAAELPVPDDDGRRRLMELYRGALVLDLADPEAVVRRTKGVTASFVKELLRRAALAAAERDQARDSRPLRVTDADMSASLDQLLDVRSQLTRALLGSQAARAAGPPPEEP